MRGASLMRRWRRVQLGCVRLIALLSLMLAQPVAGETIDLYVDPATGQVFTQPGANRSKIGTFERVDKPVEAAPPAAAPPAQQAAPAAAEPAPKVAAEPSTKVLASEAPPADDPSVVATIGRVLKSKWYERMSLRGYTQFRYNALLHRDGDGAWFVPADRSVAKDNTFFIRRGRIILSGDVTDHLYIYVQPELNALPADGDFSLQLRDLYADISIDKKKEFRFRVGQSKVPYGWVNMQSSQNRLALERPDSINSAIEGERDVGVFFYWAPEEIRARFRDLVKNGLKGSGDYGVFAFGAYSGQGLNKLDSNNNVHWVARLAYPFVLPNGQIIEPGIQGYWGKFVTRTQSISVNGTSFTPNAPHYGSTDRRVGVSAIVYPQPIGFEFEWNFGEGPELDGDQQAIHTKSLQGGYVETSYKLDFDYGIFFPFVRWQYYEGGRKFAKNAPHVDTNEWDFGIEYTPIPEVELSAIYTYTPFRVDSKDATYSGFHDASRLGLQLQWNY